MTFWSGVVAGIVGTLLVLGGTAFILFRAFNDDNWEGGSGESSRSA